jgi:DNA end-binding protein Ku
MAKRSHKSKGTASDVKRGGPRVLWKGAINFGLVHVPVALYPAAKNVGIDFDLLDRRSMKPVGYKRINKATGKEVLKKDIVRGYQYEHDQYVVISDEEIRAANTKATHSIDLFAFVDPLEIPALYLDTPYYLAPLQRGEKVYALLRETLRRANKTGLANVVIQTKQHLSLLMPVGPVLLLNTLRWASEVLDYGELNLPGENLKGLGIRDQEVSMAMELLERMGQKWDPEKYRDTFRDDIMALVERKIKVGETETVADIPAAEAEPPSSNIIDLTQLLKRSLHDRTTASKKKSAAGGGGASAKNTRKKTPTTRHVSEGGTKTKRSGGSR